MTPRSGHSGDPCGSGDAAFALLVVAKAPVPGVVKTRLCPPATPGQAAELAAACLLDTLDAVCATPGAVPVVALTGRLDDAVRADAVVAALRRCAAVVAQRGESFAQRLVHAHRDTATLRPGLPVVQIGMDTPQVTPALLRGVAATLTHAEAVVGPATDGGWWVLGLRDPGCADALAHVPMSRPDTAALTRRAVCPGGTGPAGAPALSDVDTMADAARVAGTAPDTRFAATLNRMRAERSGTATPAPDGAAAAPRPGP